MQNYLIISDDKVIIDENINKILKDNNLSSDNLIKYDMNEVLLDALRNTKNPFTCPHGRPTIISYSKYELEKLFKRAMN